jgi:crotonobetainyl-CoA:carnitine CoA-transferase CaiB-like acyl-CoA transferase
VGVEDRVAESQRLLEGVRVLDAASFIAGPVATTVMADFGADVIKIEPPDGDGYRQSFRSPGNPSSPHNYPWIVDNRSKRAIALDLRDEAGRAVLARLVSRADVFVTNLPLDARRRLRVTWEDLAPLNRRLVYASVTAYGETGPEAGKPGFDSTALWARTGLMDLVKPAPDAPPARSLPGMGDHPTGMALFGAIMAALYQRERTGTGTMVSTSLMANGLWWNAIQVQAMLSGARFMPRPPREEATNALANLYRCRDGHWFLLVMGPGERRWETFTACIGRPDLTDDPRFSTKAARHAHARQLIAILDEVFAAREWAEWRAILDAHDIAFGVVATLDDIPRDRQMMESRALVPIDDPRAGATLTVSSPIEISGQDKAPPRLAPAVGEHTVEVLEEEGYAREEIERLLASGVAVQAPPGSHP